MNLKSGILVSATALAFGGTAVAQEHTLNMSHYLPPVLGLHSDFMEPLSAPQIQAVLLLKGCYLYGVPLLCAGLPKF